MNENEKEIFGSNSGIVPFPEHTDVFFDHLSTCEKYFLPLASIRGSVAHSDLNVWLHFVVPYEPEDGCVGQFGVESYNYYCREKWYGFKIENGKYRFLTDFEYFGLSQKGLSHHLKTDLVQHYTDVRRFYESRKKIFKDQGILVHRFAEPNKKGKYTEEDSVPIIHSVGAPSHFGNWASGDEIPLQVFSNEDEYEEEEIFPITEEGMPFRFIGKAEVYNFCGTDGTLMLFYSEEKQIALFTIEYS